MRYVPLPTFVKASVVTLVSRSLPPILILTALGSVTTATFAQPIPIAPPPKLPKDYEVHWIGLYQPIEPGFDMKEITDWPAFAKKMLEVGANNKKDALHRVWSALWVTTQKHLTDDKLIAAIAPKLRMPGVRPSLPTQEMIAPHLSIRKNFKEILEDPEFSQAKEFAGLKLPNEAIALLRKADRRTVLDTKLLNRYILRAVLGELYRAAPIDPTAIEVEVKTKLPCVLVLTSYESCNWIVKVAKESELVWIISSGYRIQQIQGANCPITVEGKYNEPNKVFVDHIAANGRNKPNFPAAEARVMEITQAKSVKFYGYSQTHFETFTVK